jgi:hypothetical protein
MRPRNPSEENAEQFPENEEKASHENLPLEQRSMTRRSFGALLGRGALAAGAASVLGGSPKSAEAQEAVRDDTVYDSIRTLLKQEKPDLSTYVPNSTEVAIPLSKEDWAVTPPELQKEIWQGIIADHESGKLKMRQKPESSNLPSEEVQKPNKPRENNPYFVGDWLLGDVLLPTMQGLNTTLSVMYNRYAEQQRAWATGRGTNMNRNQLIELRSQMQNALRLNTALRMGMNGADRGMDVLAVVKGAHNLIACVGLMPGAAVEDAGSRLMRTGASLALYGAVKGGRRVVGHHAPLIHTDWSRDIARLSETQRSSAEQMSINLERSIRRLDGLILEMEIQTLPEDEYSEIHDEAIDFLDTNAGRRKRDLAANDRILGILNQSNTFRNMQSSHELVPNIVATITAELQTIQRNRQIAAVNPPPAPAAQPTVDPLDGGDEAEDQRDEDVENEIEVDEDPLDVIDEDEDEPVEDASDIIEFGDDLGDDLVERERPSADEDDEPAGLLDDLGELGDTPNNDDETPPPPRRPSGENEDYLL